MRRSKARLNVHLPSKSCISLPPSPANPMSNNISIDFENTRWLKNPCNKKITNISYPSQVWSVSELQCEISSATDLLTSMIFIFPQH